MKITCYSFQISWELEAGLQSHNFPIAYWYATHYTFITNYIFSYSHSRVRERRQSVLILNWPGIVRCWKELLMFWENYCLFYGIFFDLVWCDAMYFCRQIPTFWRNRVQKWTWWWKQQAIRHVDTCLLLNCMVSLPRTL